MAQIDKPGLHFNTILYTGDGSGTQAQTGVGFGPNMVWVKSRNATNYHGIADQVRGVDKFIYPNDTNQEQTNANDYLNSFDSDGFTHGSNGTIGQNSINYAAWNWKANGAGSANTEGSINATVSANTTAGFSIIKYTATGNVGTIGHGLNAVPKMLIFKDLSDTGGSDWYVHHTSTGVNGRLILNENNAAADNTNFLNQVLPTSTLITLGTASQANNVGNDFICYAFAEKKGYSKLGKYVGNNNNEGTFIYTGFKPAFLFIKIYSGTGQWTIFDNKRSSSGGGNEIDKILHPNVTNAENTADDVDFLSNGFKMRNTAANANGNASTYIYMAIAENPIVGSNNIPAVAR